MTLCIKHPDTAICATCGMAYKLKICDYNDIALGNYELVPIVRIDLNHDRLSEFMKRYKVLVDGIVEQLLPNDGEEM